MKHRIRVAAIIVEENKILLVKHVHPRTGYEWWVPAGGGIEVQDRSIFECAKREVFEETNLKIEASKIIYIREFVDTENKQLNIELFVLADRYTGSISLENIKGKGPDEDFIKQLKWFSQEGLVNVNVFPEVLKDVFWNDYENEFPAVRYLGRQDD